MSSTSRKPTRRAVSTPDEKKRGEGYPVWRDNLLSPKTTPCHTMRLSFQTRSALGPPTGGIGRGGGFLAPSLIVGGSWANQCLRRCWMRHDSGLLGGDRSMALIGMSMQ